MSKDLRRHIMMQQRGSDDLFGFARMYPKSEYQYPDGEVNILEYLYNHPNLVMGWRFADSDANVTVQYNSGHFDRDVWCVYIENGIIVERVVRVNNIATISATCKNRMVFLTHWQEYGYTLSTPECIAIQSNSVRGTYTSGYGRSCKQLFLHESVTTAMRSSFTEKITVGANTGGELDTCSLVFPVISSYGSMKPNYKNNLNLTSVILRKAVGTIPWTNEAWADYATPFYGCNNIAKVTMEWDILEDIPKYRTAMFPTTATLYVPAGTRDMYIAKGWNALAAIIEVLK